MMMEWNYGEESHLRFGLGIRLVRVYCLRRYWWLESRCRSVSTLHRNVSRWSLTLFTHINYWAVLNTKLLLFWVRFLFNTRTIISIVPNLSAVIANYGRQLMVYIHLNCGEMHSGLHEFSFIPLSFPASSEITLVDSSDNSYLDGR